jgi:hypothetical protein
MAFTLEIPSSQTKATSLCYCKVFLFIPTVITHKYGSNLDMKIIVKELYVGLCGRQLANFNNLSQ